MSSDPVMQTRTRRSRTITPLIPNGTPRISDTPKQSKSEHDSSYLHAVYPEGFEGTPVIGGRHVDASFRNEDKVSPMLAKLRMTPGRLLKDKQSLLVRKHESARQRVDSMNVGGGVSLWPEMESMRLTDEEVIHLAGVCVALIAFVIALFYFLHGGSVLLLLEFERNLTDFMKNHDIVTSLGQESFDETTITWHNSYRIILEKIHRSFDTTKVPMSYMMYILVYSVTICVLFYYLVDNMFAKSKLSPRRIKRWACLLSVSSTWTLLMVLNLICAYRTELAVEKNVHLLSEVLADAISLNLNCDKLHSILLYWRTRCLPPTTTGSILLFGIISVCDVIFYIQYYSIPIVTVLITPVFKVLLSLMAVYSPGSNGS